MPGCSASPNSGQNHPPGPNYSEAMPGISGGDPAFSADDGSADPGVSGSLSAFASGQGCEHAALTALADSRLLVPVMAVLAGQGSEMAMPTLIGLDSRRAIPAFTCVDSMQRWKTDARPVPVAARNVWQAAIADDCAVVVDVAGPVPFAVEGARLAALADGERAPEPYQDPDVHEIVAAALAGRLGVASFELRPGDAGRDLDVVLALADPGPGGDADAGEIGAAIAGEVMSKLGGRLRRGVAIWCELPP
jgi:hypothetical protein